RVGRNVGQGCLGGAEVQIPVSPISSEKVGHGLAVFAPKLDGVGTNYFREGIRKTRNGVEKMFDLIGTDVGKPKGKAGEPAFGQCSLQPQFRLRVKANVKNRVGVLIAQQTEREVVDGCGAKGVVMIESEDLESDGLVQHRRSS